MTRSVNFQIFLSTLLIFSWSISWILLKYALVSTDPFIFRSAVCLFCAIALFPVALYLKRNLIEPKFLVMNTIISVPNIALWHILSALGLLKSMTGNAVVIAYTMPIWAMVFGSIFYRERLSAKKIIACFLGCSSVATVYISQGAGEPLLPIALLVGAAMSWGLGTAMYKKHLSQADPLTSAIWQLSVGAGLMSLVPIFNKPLLIIHDQVADSLWVIAAISVLGAFCYWAWFKLISDFTLMRAALIPCMVPIATSFLAAIFLAEPLTFGLLAAAILVACAQYLISY